MAAHQYGLRYKLFLSRFSGDWQTVEPSLLTAPLLVPNALPARMWDGSFLWVYISFGTMLSWNPTKRCGHGTVHCLLPMVMYIIPCRRKSVEADLRQDGTNAWRQGECVVQLLAFCWWVPRLTCHMRSLTCLTSTREASGICNLFFQVFCKLAFSRQARLQKKSSAPNWFFFVGLNFSWWT